MDISSSVIAVCSGCMAIAREPHVELNRRRHAQLFERGDSGLECLDRVLAAPRLVRPHPVDPAVADDVHGRIKLPQIIGEQIFLYY